MIHNISRFIAALALLATAQGAWADTETVSYIDADGNEQTATATVLTGNEEPSKWGTIDLAAGWYVVKGNISYTNQISYASYPSGTIHIILADGAQMAVEHNGSAAIFLGNDNPLAIYGQSAGTGRLSVTSDSYAISALGGITINGGIVSATSTGYGRPAIFAYNGAITINGGQVTATPGNNAMGISTEGTITLGLRSASDFITANGYNGTVNIKSGQTLYAGATAYSGNNVSLPSGAVTIRPYSSDDFSVNDAGTEYTIHTAKGWGVFCDCLDDNDTYNRFSGKTVKLGADITVSRMAGGSGHEFTGTFNGNGKSLTVDYANTGNNTMTAPFSYVDGATIRNLIVDGTISGSAYRAAGIIGETGNTTSHITNCVSSVTISGDRYTGGFSIGGNVAIEGCVFNGKINATSRSGGFIGHSNSAQVIKNSLFAPKDGSSISGGTFYYNGGGDVDPVNCYYTRALGTAQGKALHSVTAGDDVTLALSGTATEYTVSGITAYEGNQGIKYGTTYYAGNGDVVSLTLSNTATGDVPEGYKYGYTTNAGTLSGSTLTMPAEDVTVSPALRSTGEAVEEVSYVVAYGYTLKNDAIALDGTESYLGSYDQETWYFVGLPTVAFDHMLNLNGDVHLILADGCTMNVTSSNGNGIAVNGSLTIYGQTDGTGTLNATSKYNAGIFTDSGNLTISGGRVTATSSHGVGIRTDNGTITISGGRVTATGSQEGIYTNSGTITISGGRVTATGDYGAGILSYSGTITLGCTTASDFIYASSYRVGHEGTLKIAFGQTLFDEYGNTYFYWGNGVTIPDGKTLRPGLTARQAPDGNYWTTYYNSFQDFTIEGNACAYTATYGAGQLTLHKLGKEIPAETAVIIVADNDVVSMTAGTDLYDISGTNDLHGVDDDTDVADITSDLGTGTFYVLGMTTVGDEQHFGFHRYTGEEMAAHKAFVLVDNSSPEAPARSLTMVFDEATGIVSAEANSSLFTLHSSLSTWFTLDGRRLQAKPTAPGIYVNNGKKVVIK